jgi:peptidoglycan/LPS O-acetylase OafA/YrhL
MVDMGRRDLRLDALRGACLVSMVVGHLAQGRWPDRLVHPLLVVDGAAGFVLLSGVVLGRVRRRRPDHAALVRRAGRLWALHVGLLLGGLLLKVLTGRPDFLPEPSALGGGWATLRDVALLRVQPDWFDVLPFYVVALAASPLVLMALRRGWWQPVLAASTALFAASQAGVTITLADRLRGAGAWDWGGWQLVFVGGLVAGWHWDELVAFGRGHRDALLRGGGAVTLGVAGVAQLVGVPALGPLFDKYQVGAAIPLVVVAAAAPCYWLVGRLPSSLTHPLATLGTATLPGYAALSIAQLLVFAFWAGRPVAASLALVAVVLGVTWGFAERKLRKVGPARPVHAPAPLPRPAPTLTRLVA